MVPLLFVILALLLKTTTQTSLIEVDFEFPEGSDCEYSAHVLTYSIPISCNAALENVLGDGLPLDLLNSSPEVDLGDLCQTYCTAPMRQVGEDCQELKDMYNTITAACDYNMNGSRCYDVREAIWPVRSNCSTILPCSQTCVNAMREANSTMGCCLDSMLSTHRSENTSSLWEHCGMTQPDQPCSKAVAMVTAWLVMLVVAVFTSCELK